MQQKLRLFKGSNAWMVRFENDPEVLRLFGTNTLPTPYTLRASAAAVLTAVRATNPGCDVELVSA